MESYRICIYASKLSVMYEIQVFRDVLLQQKLQVRVLALCEMYSTFCNQSVFSLVFKNKPISRVASG